jgi:phosphate transport system substrate-binding protein
MPIPGSVPSAVKMTGTLLLIALLSFAGGCTGGSSAEGGGDLTGNIQIDGSSTVYPITEAVAEEFMNEYPRVRVMVGISGTGGGFSRFARGETDISNASRPVSGSEITRIREAGYDFIEIPVAYDGLAVVVHPENTWAECLSTDELRLLWQSGSTINNWSQLREGFPDRPLNVYAPGTDSGTYDYFTGAILGHGGFSRSDFTASEDDNVLVQGIAGDRNSIGFFGLAYYEENAARLRLVAIDHQGRGCVAPTNEAVREGSYQPLARPEFIYVKRSSADRPEVQRFVEFYLEHAPRLVEEVGYVPLPQVAYDLALERFRSRTTGSLFEGGEVQVGMRIDEMLQMSRQVTESTVAVPAQAE